MTAHNDPQFKLRLPADVKARVEREASANRRTMTAQIVYLLERALPAETKSAETAPTVPAE